MNTRHWDTFRKLAEKNQWPIERGRDSAEAAVLEVLEVLADDDAEMRDVLSCPIKFYERFVHSQPDEARFFGDCFGLVDSANVSGKSDAEKSTGEKL